MNNNHDNIINLCISSSRDNITGRFFYDSLKSAWFEVIDSTLQYVSFEYSFGARWSKLHHSIDKVRRVNSTKAQWLENCTMQDFNKVRV